MAGLLGEIYKEIERIRTDTEDCLQNNKFAFEMRRKIRSDAFDEVYDYEATPRAKATRRKYRGGIIATENLNISADGLDVMIEAKAPLQHSYSYWTRINASNVVIKGLAKYKQPYPRNFLIEKDLVETANDEIVLYLQQHGHDASW